jgi:hypothetical protein
MENNGYVDSGKDASKVRKYFLAGDNLIGEVGRNGISVHPNLCVVGSGQRASVSADENRVLGIELNSIPKGLDLLRPRPLRPTGNARFSSPAEPLEALHCVQPILHPNLWTFM